ncbi:hypothetical protein [Burkholderia ubonensis]|uniref:hypothetical protein n=1 Tax=Burkholderia ubonensis TaxID=101571 RepID=UPI000A8ECE53|nr:hypothetical protein [Burkholderia ubonensis]
MSKFLPEEARERALALVKEALGAGITTPTGGWTNKPADAGESLGVFIGAAVETLTKKL